MKTENNRNEAKNYAPPKLPKRQELCTQMQSHFHLPLNLSGELLVSEFYFVSVEIPANFFSFVSFIPKGNLYLIST